MRSKVRSPVSGSPDGGRTPPGPLLPHRPSHPSSLGSLPQIDESHIVIEESKSFENRLQSLVQETIQETESSMQMLREWKWLNGGQDLA